MDRCQTECCLSAELSDPQYRKTAGRISSRGLKYIDESTPGNFSSSTPILIAQGQADGLVLPEASERLVQRLCTQETPVEIVRYDGVTHFGVVNAARADELEWVRGRLQGMGVESSCGRQGDPVIVIGRQVAEFLGLPVNQLAMYSYRSGAWLQIPAQIDDVNPAGQYTDLEDWHLRLQR